MNEFFERLKQRKLVQWAIAYAAAAFALLQGIDIVAQQFGWPEGVRRGITLALVVGFFVTLVLAWYHGERGAQRVTSAELLIIGLVLALGGGFLWHFAAASRTPDNKTATVPNEGRMHEPATVISAKSIAVLPFENLSRDPDNAFFADGVQDEILTDLAKVADLKVISRTSVIAYRDSVGRNLRKIGQELGVAHVLEGSVQRANNRIRVNAQLVDARNDTHLWAQTYDRDLADIFAIQTEIAKAIADQLQAKLSPTERRAIEQRPTTNVVAFDLYSRAKTLFVSITFSSTHRQYLFEAADLLTQAVAKDPSFFEALCLLVNVQDQIYFFHEHTPQRLALAEEALDVVFRLQPDSGEAHLTKARHFYYGYRNYAAALTELDVARKTLPNDDARVAELSGYIQRRQGKVEEGAQSLGRALELDPRNWFLLQQISLSLADLRRYAEMITILDRVLSIKPNDAETKVIRALIALDWKADTRPLHEAIAEIREKDPDAVRNIADTWLTLALAERDSAAAADALTALNGNLFGDDVVELRRSFGEGLIARMTRDEEKARKAFAAARMEQEKIIEAQPDYGPALCVLGLIDAGLGRKDEALREGRRAVELLPVEKDYKNGYRMMEYFAVTAAWVGEKELACEQLTRAIPLSGQGLTSFGQLKLSPYWDPLRGDPRFEKIVASLAPK
jgi:TolB-like protein/Tfp pilus assembly protein PilF